MHNIRTAQIFAVAIVVAAAVLASAQQPSAHADNCSDAQVVYARGTATVPPIDPVGQALVNTLSADLPGKTVSVYGINYPANFDLAWGSTSGAADSWVHILNLVALCPNTRLVLAGYSQGADIIDLLTTGSGSAFGTPTPMPDTVAGHVAAVAVFGNPSRKVGGGPLPTRSALYGAKAVDLCLTGDPICSNGADLTAHGKYVSSGLVAQAAQFAASRLVSNAG